nr:AMP-binding protein [Pseudomonadota bacterium]
EFALCGQALAGHRLEVRGAGGAALGDRKVGAIFAAGPSLMKTYFGEAARTAEVLSADGWLDTGDLGYALDGQIVITGRAKDLIIVNGRNVWPQDLEWTVERELAGLRGGDVAVFSVAEADGERVVALIQCRMGEAPAREALRTAAANLIRSRHGLDAQVTLIAPHALPLTSSGKLSRSRARSLYVSGAFERAGAAVPA